MTKVINTTIYQIEASRYLSLLQAKETVTFNNLCWGKMTGSLVPSMTLEYIQQKYKKEFTFVKDKETKDITVIRTKAIIDVTFDKELFEKGTEKDTGYFLDKKTKEYKKTKDPHVKKLLSKKQIRKKVYTEGLTIDGKHYVCFQRSSSKARQGQCLFILEYMLEDVLSWCRMGLKIKPTEKIDIASLRAYESLTMSGIIGKIKIDPEEILVIADKNPKYSTYASVTALDKNNNLICEEKEIELTSELYDGQSLLDVSMFSGEYKGKGCMLLRNKFFKSCAFNTNLQRWFADNDIKNATDIFGVVHAADKIKMITTPNSCKFLKFSEEKTMWEYWRNNIDFDFGIVKTEKLTPFEDGKQQMSYRMLNSLPLNKEQVKELAAYNIEQMTKIKNDFEYAMHFLGLDDLELKIPYDMVLALAQVNSDIQHTQLWREMRDDVIERLKKKLYSGKILIDGDYCIMVSNPIEMLNDAKRPNWRCA